MRSLLRLTLAAGSVLALSGCGGLDGGFWSPPNAVARVRIAWPDRTGSPTGPASALSARVVLNDAGLLGGTNLGWVVDRPDAPAACVTTATAPVGVWPSKAKLTVTLFSGKGADGDVLGSVVVGVQVKSDGTVSKTDGSHLGNIACVGTVASLQVVPDQSVRVAETKGLALTAFDAQANAIALPPGSAQWQLVSGGSALQLAPNGDALGLAPGTAGVTACVAGKTSPSGSITVPEVTVTVYPTSGYVALRGTQQFSVIVTGLAETDVDWSVVEAAGGSITQDGLYTAPGTRGTYHVVARASAYPTAKATVAVNVQ